MYTKSIDGDITPENLKDLIVESLDNDKAENIEVIDIKGQTAIADYMIIASGQSTRQVVSLAQNLKDRLAVRKIKDIKMEGITTGDWVALDAGDIIVHIFRPEVREFYNIEKMWNATFTKLETVTTTAQNT